MSEDSIPLNSSASDSFWQRNQDRLFASAVLALMVYSVVRNTLKASILHFWFDELCTWILAHQPNVSSIWRALLHGADGHPPPFYLLEKLSSHFVSNDEIAFRLPSILGFCLMQWCLYVCLRRRHSAAVSFAASLLPFLTPLYSVYATEARGYSLAAAFLCLALVSYQRVPDLRWTLMLALSLVAAQSSHFYSFIMMTPFFLAEAVFWLKTKSFRPRVWAAITCGYLPLIAFYSVLSHLKAYYSDHPQMMHPTLLGTLHSYGWLFGAARASSVSPYLPTVLWSLLAAGALLFTGSLLLNSIRGNPDKNATFHEDALIAGFLLLPIILFVVIRITHGVLAGRYLLAVTFGVAFAAARGLSLLNRKSVLLLAVLLVANIAILDAGFWFTYYGAYELGFRQPKPLEELAGKAGHSDLPVVASDGHDYLETHHYATPEWRERLTFLADPAAALAFGHSDFNDKELLALRDFAKLRVFEFSDFQNSRKPFLLYSNPREDNDPDWFVAYLQAKGWTLQKLTSAGNRTVFLVQ
jgi:hypothetical protein